MVYYDATKCHIAITRRSQLTAWRNADVKIVSADCIPTDQFIGATVTYPTPITTRMGTLGATRIKHRITTGRTTGLFVGDFYFQTAQFIYWIMQGCSTTENTPVGFNTHAITASATQTPISLGIHLENEMTSEDRRNDLLGLVPEELVISCNESREGWIATQKITIPFSFALRGVSGDAVDDIAAQTKRPEATDGSVIKNYGHAVNGDLLTEFKYDGTAVECDIYGVTITLTNTKALQKFDATGYAALGKLKNWEYIVELDVMPTGDDLFKIANTAKASYAGDLDLIFSFKNTTNDYVKFTFDKMYLVPFDVDAVRETDWFEGYTITLEPLDNTSSLAVEGVDVIDNDHYEDP